MQRVRQALLRLAAEDPSLRAKVLPLTRQADKWKSLPKGWTQDSVESFWSNLTGDNKHKVTKCISKMDGKVDDPGASCASLADKVMGPEWRSKKAYTTQKVNVTSLPALVKAAIAKTRVPAKRAVNVRIDTTYSMYSAGDDGARGFTHIVNLDTNRIEENWGTWGGGGLGQKILPVDDASNTQKIPLTDNLVIVQGQEGGRDPYVSLTATTDGFARLIGPRGKTGRKVQAALLDHLGPYGKLVDLVIREMKKSVQEHAGSWLTLNPKTLATGFIYNVFVEFPGAGQLAQAIWNLFERGGPSLNTSWGRQLAMQTKTRLGPGPEGLVRAGALSLALLTRTRQPKLAERLEALLLKHLADELQEVAVPGTSAPKKPAEVFEETLTANIKALAHGILQKIGTDPAVVETFAFLVAEDVNWHSIQSVGQHEGVSNLDWELVGTVSNALDYGLEDVAAFITALFRQAQLPQKAEAVKREALREFKDSYEDLGPMAD